MVSGTLTYRAEVKGFIFRNFAPLEVQTTEPGVANVVVGCPGESPIEVIVKIASSASADTARITGKSICRTILSRLSLKYRLCVQEPLVAEDLQEENDTAVTNLAAGAMPMSCPGKDSKDVKPEDVSGLKADLEDPTPPGHIYYDLYRLAMQAEDSVDRFMSLYRLLLILCLNKKGEEDQKCVDNFIERNTSEKRTHERPGMPNVLETVYSSLRNNIAHVRKGVDLAETRREMNTRVYGLAEVVKNAIRLKP